jgi:hypothetical protein
MTRPPVAISLNFMPSFYHRHAGLTYGEDYYFDVRRRSEVDRQESILLHRILGRYGVGNPDPAPSASIFIQPIDLMKLTQGARLRCPIDATLETIGTPWAGLTPDQIAALDADEAARHPIIDTVVRLFREMHALHGERADLFGLKGGMMNVHAPYTTAHQLCGEALFFLLKDDPQGARLIFAKIWEIYRAIFARLQHETASAPVSRIYLGDCSASLLSPADYARCVLPINQDIAGMFPEASYHSCGLSTRLLSSFAAIPGLTTIELGAGTDLAAAVGAMPGVAMRPLVDPSLMRDAAPARIKEVITAMLTATRKAPSTALCAWSFDRDTPVTNVECLYQTVEAWNADEGGGRKSYA